jgi:hypothetical protein
MPIPHLLSSDAAKAGLSTGTFAVVQDAARGGILHLDPALYTLFAMLIGLAGVWLARLVTIGDENKKLGRVQTLRETGPLTWIGVLIVCPVIWHWDIAVPWASFMGLGVGYSVRIVLKIFGGGAVSAARAIARRAADALDEQGIPSDDATPPAAPLPAPVQKHLDAPGARPAAVLLGPTDMPADQAALIEQLKGIPPVAKSE